MKRSLVVTESQYTIGSSSVVLGSGSFGETVKAQDRRTKDFVVIHRIPTDEMSRTKQQQYQQDIEEIAKCRHMFIVPVLGYSQESPSIVVTEFMPDGSLDQVMEKWNQLKWFDDTTRTILALGIAKAMQYLREVGLYHRNLKPSNVMIEKAEDTYVPRLTDFELVKYATDPIEDEFQSGDPEFTEKSDVYSYGQILNSLLENRKSSGKTKEIEKLIKKCTSKKPEDRPSFDDIFAMFETDKLAFPKADKDHVDMILKQIQVHEKQRHRKKFKKLITVDEDFAEDVVEYGMNLKEQEALYFFQTIAPHFDKKTTKDVFAPMLMVCRKLTLEKGFCEAFLNAQLHLRLPYDRRDLLKMVFDIVLNIIHNCPNGVDERTSNILAYLLPGHEKMVLYLVAEYAKQFSELENPWTLLDAILLQWKKVEEEIPRFLSIFYVLCRYHPVYSESRMKYCLDIAAKILAKTQNEVVAKSAVAFLTELARDTLPLKMSLVLKLLKQEKLVDSVLLLLLAVNRVDWTNEAVAAVVRLASEDRNAGLLLAKIADSPSGSSALLSNPDFITKPLPDYKSTLRVILVLLKGDKKQSLLKQSSSIARLAFQMAQSPKTSDALYALNLLSVVKCNTEIVNVLKSGDFFEIRNREDIQPHYGMVLLVFANCAMVADNACFSEVIKKLEDGVSKKMRFEALQFLVAVSRFPGYAEQLKAMHIPEMFAQYVQKHEKYAQHVAIIMKNVTAFTQKKKQAEEAEEEENEYNGLSSDDLL